MTNTFQMKLDSIQPSQLYVSSEKLDRIMKSLERSKPVFVEPIPIKKLANQVIFVDGHTRALAAYLLGFSKIAVYWENEELDWDEYKVCVKWCKEEGIYSISDLEKRVVSPRNYQVLWLDRCERMQKDLKEKRKAQKSTRKHNNVTK